MERNFAEKIIDESIDGFFIINKEYRIIKENKSFREIFNGFDFLSESIYLFDLVSRESKRNLKKRINNVLKNKSSETAEIKIMRGSQKKFYLISLNPVRQLSAKRKFIYGFIKDITEIKNLQYQLEQERNYNRSIIENVNLGFVMVNDDNEYLDFNNEYLSILKRDKKELKEKTFYDFTAPAYIEVQKKLNNEMIHTGKSYILEKEFIRKDGSTIPVLVSMSRLVDKNNKVVGNFAFIRDISDQKRIENEFKSQNEKILNLIGLYNTISAKFLKCADIDDVFSVLSDFIEKIISPDSIEILLRQKYGFRSSFSVRPVTRSKDIYLDERISLLVKKLITKQSVIFTQDIKTELNDEDIAAFPGFLRYKSGIFIPMSIRDEIISIIILSFKKTIKSPDEILMNVLIGISNLASITIEKIMSIEEQIKMKNTLDRAERFSAMGTLIAGVAHEINNPLSIMQLDLDELRSSSSDLDEKTNAACSDIIESLQEEIRRMTGIVNQLKDYSNPSRIDTDNIFIDELLKTIPIKIFFKNLMKKGITLNLNLNAGKSAIQIPKDRLIQVMMNLLSNADDAIENKTSGEIYVETGRLLKDKALVYILVRDNGSGIAPENFNKIFEPFFSTKQSEGTGLGLSISYSIIKGYNGEIHVSSTIGKGSEFTVYFPEIH